MSCPPSDVFCPLYLKTWLWACAETETGFQEMFDELVTVLLFKPFCFLL